MDVDGVTAALCFPSFPRFAGGTFIDGVLEDGDDPELAKACVVAWNDFMIDEWAATDPGRYIPLGILPLWDVEASESELLRLADKGVRTISFPEMPSFMGLPSFHTDHWDRLFSILEEAGIPLSMHFGSGGYAPAPSPDSAYATRVTLFGCNAMYAAVDLMFSPVFHKHPDLRVALSEGGIGWMPYILERADNVWERHRQYQNINQEVRPSELFRKHIYGCFIDDDFGLQVREHIGVSQILWECDYPHSDSHWPNSRLHASELLRDVDDADAHAIVERNARELFRFPRAA